MTNASPRTTVAATTAPSSENTGPSPPGPNCSASPPARLPNSFMSVSMWRRYAGITAQPQPTPAPRGGGSMQGNNSPVNKRTVRPRRKIGAWHAVAAARRSTRRRVSAVVFWLARWRAPGPGGKLTTPIFDRSRARPHPPRRLSSFIGLYRPLPTRLAAALEGSA